MRFLYQLAGIICCMQLCSANEEYQTKAESEHNAYRKKHHASDLKLCDKLNELALKCAEHYANLGSIDHSCKEKGKAGENLFIATGNSKDTEWAQQAVKMWYDEVAKYDYEKFTFSGDTGHFTQVVWKGSEKLGFGLAKKNGNTIAVALYNPAGNMMGDFKKNVMKP